MNELTLKLYSPLTADFLSDDAEYWSEDNITPLIGFDLAQYQGEIQQMVTARNSGDWDGNIMQYYHKEDGLAQKVIRAEIGIAVRNRELQGCTAVTVKEPLTADELSSLKDYLTGQYSDGWGESFEQQDIRVADGSLNVHFWQHGDFAFEVEQIQALSPVIQPPSRPKLPLQGHDRSIFAILARANRLLKSEGQTEKAMQMISQVLDSNSYDEALGIISDYVELEDTLHLSNLPKQNRGDAR